MNRIRILVTGLPRMLHDVVLEALAREDDMEVVAESPTLSEAGEAIRRAQADAVVLGCGGAELPDVARPWLSDQPRLTILAIVGEGRTGVLVGEPSTVLEDISPQGLVAAIRASCLRRSRPE